MEKHFHTGLETIIVAGVSAVVFINVLRMSAAWLGTKPGIAGKVGTGLGATVHFG